MLDLHFHNSATRRKEKFTPLDALHVRMYVCGPTVYDLAHIGNARPVIVFDVLSRLLRRVYPRVTYARNITDVDDKIIDRARDSGEPIDSITTRTTADYHADMASVGAMRPDIEPRATTHIAEMITLIEKLIAGGHAYAAEGHVLFAVKSFDKYGKLSGRSPEDLLAGARVEVATYKNDPGDFVLWKPSTDDMPGWNSPWGRGRPGWHIECSAMSWKHLGESFDIHGGGEDLLFPHHENEVAQSLCAFPGSVFARVWMHNGMLRVNGEKMSKSLGNFRTVRDLLALGPWAGEAYRMLVLKTHYRAVLDYSEDALHGAKKELDRFQRAMGNAKPSAPHADVLAALADDLNTPLAVSVLHRLADAALAGDADAASSLRASVDLLGLCWTDAETWFRGEGDNAVIEAAINARLAARAAKNFAEADRIRADLLAQGILLEDNAGGTTWRRAS